MSPSPLILSANPALEDFWYVIQDTSMDNYAPFKNSALFCILANLTGLLMRNVSRQVNPYGKVTTVHTKQYFCLRCFYSTAIEPGYKTRLISTNIRCKFYCVFVSIKNVFCIITIWDVSVPHDVHLKEMITGKLLTEFATHSSWR